MALGYTQPLYVLAFDHRGSFQKKMLGIPGARTPEERARISDAKAAIFQGFKEAVAQGAPRRTPPACWWTRSSGDVAREARSRGLRSRCPSRRADRTSSTSSTARTSPAHILEFDPTFSKVLVRYNPEGDAEMNGRQSGRLKRLSDWLHAHDRSSCSSCWWRRSRHQLEAVGGDAGRYDREVRPGLMVRAIEELQRAGIEPDIWKIEGIDGARTANGSRRR